VLRVVVRRHAWRTLMVEGIYGARCR
jgi:hypothetical protein